MRTFGVRRKRQPTGIHAALALHRRGFSVFPVAHDKRPLVAWKPYQTTRPTTAMIREWWQRWPHANPGIATGAISGIIVVDIDTPEALHGVCRQIVTPTLTVLTARGIHMYYAYPGHHVPNTRDLMPGVDVRGDGGYVVAPGAIHTDGTRYQIVADIPLQPIPDWLINEQYAA